LLHQECKLKKRAKRQRIALATQGKTRIRYINQAQKQADSKDLLSPKSGERECTQRHATATTKV